jgi:hypothetical protein
MKITDAKTIARLLFKRPSITSMKPFITEIASKGDVEDMFIVTGELQNPTITPVDTDVLLDTLTNFRVTLGEIQVFKNDVYVYPVVSQSASLVPLVHI